MATWELAIAVCNEPEPWRKQEGDIIAFKPSPWNWGKKELDQYLIVTVSGLSQEEVETLCRPLYENDECNDDVIHENKISTIKKRKYKLPLVLLRDGWIPELDTQKVRNKTLEYQPIKLNKVVIDATEKVAIFLNKYTETYKYPDKKIYTAVSEEEK